MPSLYKEGNIYRGDSGSMSLQVWVENGQYKVEPGRPVVGRAIRVGSLGGRSFSAQDWWQTSRVVEIIEESETYVRFKTVSGSIYVWEE
jgi:hypothetical protein